MHTSSDAGRLFIDTSRRLLRADYLPRIARCLDALSEAEVWWRPNDASNSVGNLVLHLAGNVRQWVVSGVGDAEDVRERQAEFDTRGPLPKAVLLDRLRETLDAVDRTLDALPAEALLETRAVQEREVTKLYALYHAVEHFSMHTGQIIYVTKLLRGEDLGFFRFEGRRPERTF